MGMLINGVWHHEVNNKKFAEEMDQFNHFITTDGSSRFEPEPHRYHLYIALACPWACRTLVFRKLKGLEDIISLSIVDPIMGEDGWFFSSEPGCIPDDINGCQYLHQIYTRANPNFTGRVSTPVLWDKKHNTIVNNESSEIIRMFNSQFNDLTNSTDDFYPDHLHTHIDTINEIIFQNINRGVYKAGFSDNQHDYNLAFDTLFRTLDEMEDRLSYNRYLVGDQITEADWRFFMTLIRFDAVYYVHFKCNLRLIQNYPNLYGYTRELYQHPGIAETINFEHIKQHYYASRRHINPYRIVPKGPAMDFSTPHHRENCGRKK